MPSPHTLAALAALAAVLATATASSITFHNAGAEPICYMAETSSGTFPSATPCGPGTGIALPAGHTTTVPLPPTFNGALTAWASGTRGARYEVNFAATPGSTWYDADYQLGMSDGTLGPADRRPRAPGLPSTAGEPDTLAKANAAWPRVPAPDRPALLADPRYLRLGPDGALAAVYCDALAPPAVVHFFQSTADFTAYVDAGSAAGVPGEDASKADTMSWVVDTQDMAIVAY